MKGNVRITGSATKTLDFARRNIKTKHRGGREMAYNTLVSQQLEYAAAVWDPHTKLHSTEYPHL